MQEELEQAARGNVKIDRNEREMKERHWRDWRPQRQGQGMQDFHPARRQDENNWREDEDRNDNGQDETPDRWEQLIPDKPKRRVRNPPNISRWFGNDSETDSSEDTEGTEWNEVERGKKNEKKKALQKKKRKYIEKLTALKASHMIGVGPVDRKKLESRRKEGMTYSDVKEMAIRELLAEQLEYEPQELDEIKIEETRFATNGDNMIYLAIENLEHIKEIHVRKAELKNDVICV